MSAKLARRCKEAIKNGIGYEEWLRSQVSGVTTASEDGQVYFCCPAHEDDDPSASFNINEGVWNCKSSACGARGDAIDLFLHTSGAKNKHEAIQQLAVQLEV